jgi:hypothetical protein
MVSRKKRKFVQSAEAIACRIARAREVRDLYSRLRKKYRPDLIDKFFVRTISFNRRPCTVLSAKVTTNLLTWLTRA